MHIEIKKHHFLGDVDWSPQGLCALTGPNSSGKSTLLRVFHIMSINRYDDEFNGSNVKVDGQSLYDWFNDVYGPEDDQEDDDDEGGETSFTSRVYLPTSTRAVHPRRVQLHVC